MWGSRTNLKPREEGRTNASGLQPLDFRYAMARGERPRLARKRSAHRAQKGPHKKCEPKSFAGQRKEGGKT